LGDELGSVFDFQQVLEREHYVLTDAAPCSAGYHHNWYAVNVYPASRFYELDGVVLAKAVNIVEQLAWWYSQENVHATPRVLQEIMRFKDILCKKTDALWESEQRFERFQHRKLSEDYVAARNAHKETLEYICLGYSDVCRSARNSIFQPSEQDDFAVMEEAAMQATVLFSSKHESVKKMVCGRKSEDLHADEELVAAAFYRSVFLQQESCIVSPDSDIGRIIYHSYRFIDEVLLKGDKMVRAMLTEHPVRYYFVVSSEDGGQVQLRLDTSQAMSPIHRPVEKVA
jgi:hypothetical protein